MFYSIEQLYLPHPDTILVSRYFSPKGVILWDPCRQCPSPHIMCLFSFHKYLRERLGGGEQGEGGQRRSVSLG